MKIKTCRYLEKMENKTSPKRAVLCDSVYKEAKNNCQNCGHNPQTAYKRLVKLVGTARATELMQESWRLSPYNANGVCKGEYE